VNLRKRLKNKSRPSMREVTLFGYRKVKNGYIFTLLFGMREFFAKDKDVLLIEEHMFGCGSNVVLTIKDYDFIGV